MGYVTMTKPSQGDVTKKSEIDQLIDNDEALNDAAGVSTGIVNGSFETGSGADAPTGWVRTTWGTAAYDTTDPAHGDQCYSFTSTGAGGGKLVSENFINCAEDTPVILSFYLKSTDAQVKNIVAVHWYDKDESSISTSIIYSDDTTNPTDWNRNVRGTGNPPSGACFMKIELTFCDSSDATSGTTYMDGVEIVEEGVEIIVGNANGNLGGTGNYADRIYFDGVLMATGSSSGADGATESLSYALADVAIGSAAYSYAVTLRYLTTVRGTVTITLTAGIWTVYGVAHWRNGDGASDSGDYHLTAIAVRQSTI